jgi:hypothetical protein
MEKEKAPSWIIRNQKALLIFNWFSRKKLSGFSHYFYNAQFIFQETV